MADSARRQVGRTPCICSNCLELVGHLMHPRTCIPWLFSGGRTHCVHYGTKDLQVETTVVLQPLIAVYCLDLFVGINVNVLSTLYILRNTDFVDRGYLPPRGNC